MRIEVCRIHDRIHEVHFTEQKLPKGCMWSGERLTKIQATTRPDYVWPETCMVWHAKSSSKKKKSMGHLKKPKLDDGRVLHAKSLAEKKKLRGIYFIDPENGEYDDTIKKRTEKLEIPMEAAVLCKMGTKKRSNKSRKTANETKESNNIQKTKRACIVEAHESTRRRLESTLPRNHEDHIAEKGFTSVSHCNLAHK